MPLHSMAGREGRGDSVRMPSPSSTLRAPARLRLLPRGVRTVLHVEHEAGGWFVGASCGACPEVCAGYEHAPVRGTAAWSMWRVLSSAQLLVLRLLSTSDVDLESCQRWIVYTKK